MPPRQRSFRKAINFPQDEFLFRNLEVGEFELSHKSNYRFNVEGADNYVKALCTASAPCVSSVVYCMQSSLDGEDF